MKKYLIPVPALLREVVTYIFVAFMFTVGVWVYDLRRLATEEITAIQNRIVEEQLFSDVRDAESGQRGYLLSHGDRDYLPQYLNGIREVHSDVRLLKMYLRTRPDEQKTFTALSLLVDKKLEELKGTVDLTDQGGFDRASAEFSSKKGLFLMLAIRDQIDTLRAQELDYIRHRSNWLF